MADIRLAKPAAGASESVQCAPDARFVFDFPTTDATLAREGDNLNISFQDGSQLRLEGFYQEYNGENLPSFNIDGTEVAAADFFQAMNEPDLMPAAGPGTGTVANGARFHEWGDSALTGGIQHLDGLDWGFSRNFEWEDHPNAVGYDDDGWRGAVNTVPDLDVPAAPERPYDPRNPGDDPKNPASPQNPGGYIPNTHGASIVVDEGALARGSGQHVLHGAHDFGSFVADVHAERGGSIELSFGGKVVSLAIPQDGSLRIAPSGDASFANVNGVDIRILGAESAGDGKWTVRYEYQLADHIVHDKQIGQDMVRYDGEGIAISVTDGSGDVVHGRLTVEVHDDVPLISAVQAGEVSVNNAVEFAFGADDDRGENGDNLYGSQQQVVVRVGEDETPLQWSYGTQSDLTDISLMESGDVWTATVNVAGSADENGESVTIPVQVQVTAQGGKYVFEYADKSSEIARPALDLKVEITDADGDTKEATLHLATPGLEVPPTADPKPDPEAETPPAPDTPGHEAFILATGKAHIVVDEGALAKGNGAKEGGHDYHDKQGSGSFNVELPHAEGGVITLVVPDTDGNPVKDAQGNVMALTITIHPAADGENATNDDIPEGASLTANGVTLSGFTLEGPKTGADGQDTWTVKYHYELTEALTHDKKGTVDNGEEPGDYNTDQVIFDADAIHITVTDGTGDTVSGQINIEVHDDVPVVTAPAQPMVLTYGEGGAATTSSGAGEFGKAFGADGELEGGGEKYTLQVKEAYTQFQAKTADGEWQNVTLTADEDGKTVAATFGENGEHTAFTLTIDPATGVVSMDVADHIAIRHPTTQADGGANKDISLDGVQRVLTLTDGDGDARSASQDIAITIADTAATFTGFTQDPLSETQQGYDGALSIDFTTAQLDKEIVKEATRWYKAGKETINIFGTHVAYNLDANGHVILLEDQVIDFANTGNMVKNPPLWLSDRGLGIGSADGAGKTSTWTDGTDFGVGTGVISENSPIRTKTDFHSEGVVIEPENGAVNYGLTLTLSDFGQGERAILAFYLTPKGSNDNAIVKYVELPADVGYQEDGKYEIQIPDGFTKCIIAPIPKTDELASWNNASSKSESHFKIAKIEFVQPDYTHTGNVTWDPNVDGMQKLTWDWSAVKDYFGTSVTLHDTLGADSYTVNFPVPEKLTDDTITVTLSGKSSQDARDLFTATLNNQTGTWEIKQFYNFTLDNGNSLEKCPIRFTIIDGDGSVTEKTYELNLALAKVDHRFDHVEVGAFDADNWEGWAYRDNVYDVLQGEGVNDLMYGRGGNDILFGDNIGGQAGFNSFASQVLGTTYTGGYTEYADPDKPALSAGQTGPIIEEGQTLSKNENIFNQISTRLEALIADKNYDEIERLVGLAEGSQSHRGNDALFGGVGNDILFGGDGDDYLVGTGSVDEANTVRLPGEAEPGYTDSNMLFGGRGRDILVYNKADKILDGGDGIDILLMGRKDWKDYNKDKYTAAEPYKASLNRLLAHVDTSAPVVRGIELLLVSKNTDFVEQLGITSQDSLEKYGIRIMGNTVQLDDNKWCLGNLYHALGLTGTSYLERYVYTDKENNIDLQLDVIRDGKTVRLENYEGELFNKYRNNDPARDCGDEASAACLMDEDNPVPLASAVPGDGEHMSDAVTFAAPPAQEETLDADSAPETRPADVTETPESFLARVEGLGGEEADILFGSSGNDHLDSVEDKYVFADAGDDLIVYDATDYLIDGGDGIDFLLAGNAEAHSLADMMKNWEKQGKHDENMPMVHDVEVMLKGVDMSLQNMDELAEAYGFKMKPQNGRDTLELDSKHWQKLEATDADAGIEPAAEDADATSKTLTFQHLDNDGKTTGVTLETTLTQEVGGTTEGEQAAIILANSNG